MSDPEKLNDDDVPEGVRNIVDELTGDLKDRFENLTAIKGKKFSDYVDYLIAMTSYTNFALSAPQPMARLLAPPMVGSIMRRVGTMLELSEEEQKEAFNFADNMTKSIDAQVGRIKEELKKDG